MHYKQLFLFVAFIGFGLTVSSQNYEETFDRMISQKYPTDEPGTAVLIAKEGEVIYNKAFGIADLELDVPMKKDMVFEIGSITKQFTAISILMLLEEGKLALDDDITKYIDDYPTHGHTITIHHLLTHTSGIKSYTSMGEWQGKWRQDYKPKEFIDFFKNEPMNFAPGEKFSYNNSAYFLLGYIIKQVSGESYPEFLEKHIFKPLNMANTYYGSQTEIIEDRASGYQSKNGFVNAEYLSLTQPYSAGAIMSTVSDLYKWNKALHEYKLVEKETLQKAFTNYKLNNGEPINYGYGWAINEIHDISTIEHGGGIFGFTTNAIYIPDKEVFVAMFTNRSDFSPSSVSTRIAAKAIGKPYPVKEDRIELEDDFLKSLTGVYDFEDGTTRYIRYEDGQLYSQKKESKKFEIFPIAKDEFCFEDSFTKYKFAQTQDGKVKVILKKRIDETSGIKTDRKIPEEEKGIEVSEKVLKQYVGEYELKPNFTIVISLEDGQLKAQATGQGKHEIYAKSRTRFFYKVVDAEIEFIKNEQGEVDAMILYQGGRKMKGEKK
jgi:CubicO group peptidase (beta-lactamase class C family)